MSKLTLKAPAMVMRHLRSVDEQLKDIVSIKAFGWRCAKPMHLQRLADMLNLAMIGASMSPKDKPFFTYCDTVMPGLLRRLQARFDPDSPVGIPADEAELSALQDFYLKVEQFWAGQPGNRLLQAQAELRAFKAAGQA